MAQESPLTPAGGAKPPLIRWRTALYFLGGGAILLVFASLVLGALGRDQEIPAETKLVIFFMLTLLVLAFSVGSLGYVLHSGLLRQRYSPLLLALVLAYALPALVLFALTGFLYSQEAALREVLLQVTLLPALFPGQPWLFLWQALILAFLGRPLIQQSVAARSLSWFPSVPFGLLAGLALGLLAAFAYSLTVARLENSAPASLFVVTAEIPALVRVVTLVVALTVAPWAEERFFRGELLARWQPRLGRAGAALATAALFATLQLRPLLWLPAFLAGLGLAFLAQSTGRLREAVLAHAAANLVVYFLGWYLVF